MTTAEELLTASDVIWINVETRTMEIPSGIQLIGVESDDVVQRLHFGMPRYYNDIDLSGYDININYENAKGGGDVYAVTDAVVDTETITFSWLVGRFATMYQGNVEFNACLKIVNSDDEIVSEFNTTPATLPVLRGLETGEAVVVVERDAISAAVSEALREAVDSELKGNPGYTPVKGTDYYTDAEKEAFVEEVIQSHNARVANSFTGTASGEIIRVDDVNPIEHTVKAKVSGKNRFDISKIQTTPATPSNAYVGEVGNDYIVVRTQETYSGNGYCTVPKKLKEVCPTLEVGKTYVLTAVTESNSTNVYLPGIQKSWIFGSTMVMTETILNSTMTFYGLSSIAGFGTGDCRISNIQIEEGSAATEYEPYVDPSTVTVTRCGKNLLNTATFVNKTVQGITLTRNADGSFSVNGTNSSSTNVVSVNIGNVTLPAGTYTMSGANSQSSLDFTIRIRALKRGSVGLNGDVFDKWTQEVAERFTSDIYIQVGLGKTVNCVVYPMIENGTEYTEFRAYNGETYTPLADGSCELVSVAPTMTIFTDTPGANIECEYGRDTNIALSHFEQALDNVIAIQEALIGGGTA